MCDTKVKVMVVDDHPIVLRGLVDFLEGFDEVVVVSKTSDGSGATLLAEKYRPDMILLDISLNQVNGLDLLGDIKRSLPECEIIIYSNHDSQRYIQRAIKNGARAYILKNDSLDEIIIAIRSVQKGRIYLSPNLPEETLDFLIHGNKEESTNLGTLTPREHEIANLLSHGWDVKKIANSLCISPKTVWVHRSKIMQKFACTQSNELMVKLIKHFPSH